MRNRAIQLLSFHRYPEFLVDVVFSRALFAALRAVAGFRIGECVRVRGLPIVSLARGSSIRIGSHAYLISRSRNTALGVNHAIVLRTMKATARIQIGDHFSASGCTLCAASAISIGDRVMLGANVTVVDTDFHSLDPAKRFSLQGDGEDVKALPLRIGNDVFVGMGAMLLKGVTVGNEAVIGAGAVVTKDVPDGAIVAGNPARIISYQHRQ